MAGWFFFSTLPGLFPDLLFFGDWASGELVNFTVLEKWSADICPLMEKDLIYWEGWLSAGVCPRTEGKAKEFIPLFTFFLFLLERVSFYSRGWLETHDIAQAALEPENSGCSDLDLSSKVISCLTEQMVSPFFWEMRLVNCLTDQGVPPSLLGVICCKNALGLRTLCDNSLFSVTCLNEGL